MPAPLHALEGRPRLLWAQAARPQETGQPNLTSRVAKAGGGQQVEAQRRKEAFLPRQSWNPSSGPHRRISTFAVIRSFYRYDLQQLLGRGGRGEADLSPGGGLESTFS